MLRCIFLRYVLGPWLPFRHIACYIRETQLAESVSTLRQEFDAAQRAGLDVEWTTDIGLPFDDIKACRNALFSDMSAMRCSVYDVPL